MRLTDDRIKSLPLPPAGRRIDIHDDALPGLVLRVASTGIKTFTVYRRLKGHNPVRVTIGRWPAVSVKTARERARREIDALASGTDTRPARRAAKAKGMTVRSILEEYLRLHAQRHKAAYQRDLRRMINAELKPLADKAVTSIDGGTVVEWHRKFASRAVADKAGRVLRAVLRFAAGHHDLRGPDGKVASEALGTLRLWAKPKRKKTIVRDMLAWRAAVEALPQGPVRDLLIVLALTGLRRSEWREARWHQVDLLRSTLRLPDPKSRVDTEIPLSSGVLKILRRVQSAGRHPDAAIFSLDGRRPIGTKKLHEAVAATWKVVGRWQLHDLRRGFSTRADMMVPPAVARRLMGHATAGGDAHDGYFAADATTLRPFAERVADAVFKAPAEVVTLAQRRTAQ
jgi:integrase